MIHAKPLKRKALRPSGTSESSPTASHNQPRIEQDSGEIETGTVKASPKNLSHKLELIKVRGLSTQERSNIIFSIVEKMPGLTTRSIHRIYINFCKSRELDESITEDNLNTILWRLAKDERIVKIQVPNQRRMFVHYVKLDTNTPDSQSRTGRTDRDDTLDGARCENKTGIQD